MIIVAVCLLAALTVPLLGGSFVRLRHTQIFDGEFLAISFFVQVAAISLLPAWLPDGIGESLHLASYAFALWFVWANRRLAGVWMLGLGGLMNLAAIVANGGVMPADPDAVARAGLDVEAGFSNSAAVHSPKLAVLGDIWAVPSGLPLANVFSIGDVLLGAGCALILWQGTDVVFFRIGRMKPSPVSPI